MKAAKRARRLEIRRLKKVRYGRNLAKRIDAEIEAMKNVAEAETTGETVEQVPETQASPI